MILFARTPYDEVTVADIATVAELTPAAVYYHFDGKEQILLEGMSEFSAELIRVASERVTEGDDVGTVLSGLISYVRTRQTAATVFFVTTAGLNLGFEAHRKHVRAELSELFAGAARSQRVGLKKAEAGVIGAALVSLLEVGATEALGRDRSFKTLGSRRSLTAVAELATRIVGP